MAKLQYKEFKRKVENGSITDLKPYVSYSGAFRVLIASKGQHIDELLTYKEPDVMVELIKNGYASEHYEEWKTTRINVCVKPLLNKASGLRSSSKMKIGMFALESLWLILS